MSVDHKLQEESEHLREVDARLQALDRAIDEARHSEENALHPRSSIVEVPPQNLDEHAARS
jgi:hypothetical protein